MGFIQQCVCRTPFKQGNFLSPSPPPKKKICSEGFPNPLAQILKVVRRGEESSIARTDVSCASGIAALDTVLYYCAFSFSSYKCTYVFYQIHHGALLSRWNTAMPAAEALAEGIIKTSWERNATFDARRAMSCTVPRSLCVSQTNAGLAKFCANVSGSLLWLSVQLFLANQPISTREARVFYTAKILTLFLYALFINAFFF